MKSILPFCWLIASAVSMATDPKVTVFDFEAMADGDPPMREVMVVDGDIQVKTTASGKVLEIAAAPMLEANALLGVSAKGSASIEARVLTTKSGRSFPRFGIGVHGQTGYRLYVSPAKKELQLTKGAVVIKSVPFEWTSETWTHLKLDVRKGSGDAWEITAKAWAESTAEPQAPQMVQEDKGLSGLGRCSLWGTPFAGTPIDFDDVRVSVEWSGK